PMLMAASLSTSQALSWPVTRRAGVPLAGAVESSPYSNQPPDAGSRPSGIRTPSDQPPHTRPGRPWPGTSTSWVPRGWPCMRGQDRPFRWIAPEFPDPAVRKAARCRAGSGQLAGRVEQALLELRPVQQRQHAKDAVPDRVVALLAALHVA